MSDRENLDEMIRVAVHRLTATMCRENPGLRAHFDETDISNEVYLRLHDSIDELKPTTARQWLGLVALETHRTLLDILRRIRLPRPATLDLIMAIDNLPPDLREVVLLLHFQGLTQAEVAALYSVHEDTVKRWWAKARVFLAKEFGLSDVDPSE